MTVGTTVPSTAKEVAMEKNHESFDTSHANPAPIPAAGEKSIAHGRGRALSVAAIVLFMPVAYLVVYYAFPGAASAGTGMAAIPSANASQAISSSASVDQQINLSLSYIRGNQPGRALPVLDAVLAENPKNSIAWNNRCVAHTMLMSYDLGISDCQKALHIDPSYQLAKNNLKWAQDEFAKPQTAIAEQERSPLATRDAAFYLAEGLNFLHVGGSDQAIKAWQRTLELSPRNALAANNIGSAYMAKQDPKAALEWFSKALALDPNLEVARNNVAWAKSELNKAAASRPQSR